MKGNQIKSPSWHTPQKSSEEDVSPDPWLVNDLCRAHEEGNDAIIYRVIDVQSSDWDLETLTLKPVHGIVTDIKNERCIVVNSEYCKKLSLLDVAAEYTRLGAFIANEAKRRSIEPPQQHPLPKIPEIPMDHGKTKGDAARDIDPRYVQDKSEVFDDDFGLCTDISARDETMVDDHDKRRSR